MTIERDDNDGLNYVVMTYKEQGDLEAEGKIASVIEYSSFQGENDAQSFMEYIGRSGLHQYVVPYEQSYKLARAMPLFAAMVSDFDRDGIQYVNINDEGVNFMRVVDYVMLLVSGCSHE